MWKQFELNGYLKGQYNLALMLNVDWFQPFKHSSYSLGVIYLVILNLPKACPHYKAVSICIDSDLDQTDSSRIEHVRTRTRSSRIEPVAGVDHVM